MAFGFEKLLVYQKAVDFAAALCTRAEQFPRGGFARKFLATCYSI